MQTNIHNAEFWNLKGIASFKIGYDIDALNSFLNAIEIKPDAADYHFNCGVARYTLRQVDEAEAEFRRCLRLRRDHKEAISALRQIRASKGHLWHWWFSRQGSSRWVYRTVGSGLLLLLLIQILSSVFYTFSPLLSEFSPLNWLYKLATRVPPWQYLFLTLTILLFLFLHPFIPRLSMGGVGVDIQILTPPDSDKTMTPKQPPPEPLSWLDIVRTPPQ